MKSYCEKCKKNMPTIVVGDIIECQMCGTEIAKKKQFINKEAIKSLKDLCETDPNSGKYKNAQKVGRNVGIGVFILVLGIIYSFFGLYTTVIVLASLIIILLLISAGLWTIVVSKEK